MKTMLVGMGLVLSACIEQSPPIEPNEATIETPYLWIRGQPTAALLAWPNFFECGMDNWGCQEPYTPMTVQHVTCHGCDILEDPTGKTSQEPIALVAVATTDDTITITVDMRFDATGAQKRVVATVMGDHEVGLDAQCRLVDTAALANTPGSYVPASLLHDCSTTRLPTETVLIFPAIRTYHGHGLFPFCVGESNPCRADVALSMTPAPTRWAFSDTLQNYGYSAAYFGALPPPGSAQMVSLSVPLLDGTISSASLAIPPLAPSIP